jgi:acyl-CoA reductase-like NAD-dependent aldehyde dehydrogenase
VELSQTAGPPSAAPARDAAPYVAGSALEVNVSTDLCDPYRGDLVARVAISSAEDVRAAVTAAAAAQPVVAAMPVHARARVLRRAGDLIESRAEAYAATITRQTGKALKNTLREVRRAAWTMRAAATAAEALHGRVMVPDAAPDGEGVLAITLREPVGIVGAVTPFNAPFNLVAHKVAPAFAAGNAIVVKPATQAPLAALDLALVLEEAGAPPGAINVVPGNRETVAGLLSDERVSMFTLTGSRSTGEAIVRGAGLRKVVLELGGNSPNIVHRDAAIAASAAACVRGGFANTGQSCNSVQRILVHRDVVEEFTARVVEAADRLVVGDPLDPATDVGTLVDVAAAERIEEWVADARDRGARLLSGGARHGAQLQPTVVTDAPLDSKLVCEEVFGPVVVLLPYNDIDEAIEQANSTPFGLQAAVFTGSIDIALEVARGVRAGTVLVNKSTNFRMDHLPYGGVKESGIGREGPAYAVEEMSNLKLVVIGRSDATA